jgi:hypothetical protein
MALKKDVVVTQDNFEGQLIAKDAYWKINRMYGNKDGFNVEVHVLIDGKVYKQVDASFVPDLGGSNFIHQAYLHLKTLPEFAGATDC